MTRRLHLLLAPHGLAYLAPRIHEHYGTAAHQILTDDPYRLTSVFGVGFAIADRIARASGTPPDPAKRERAAIMHVLAEAERGGSTCLPAPELLADAARAAQRRGRRRTGSTSSSPRATWSARQEWVYRRATAELEAELAARVDALSSGAPSARLARSGAGIRHATPMRPAS